MLYKGGQNMKVVKKKLEFPEELKDRCNTYLSRKNLEITYINGYLIEFKNTNISSLSPHKILIKSDAREVVILYYGEYYYDDKTFFINDTSTACSFHKLRELVASYF